MLKNKTFQFISYCTCPTFYVSKHLSCITYGRVPTKRRDYVGTRILCINMDSTRQFKSVRGISEKSINVFNIDMFKGTFDFFLISRNI